MKFRPLLTVPILLITTSCIDSEESCYDNLKSDFEASINFGKSQSCKDNATAEQCLRYSVTASNSVLRLTSIYIDEDQSACDYFSDGPIIKRK